MKKLIIGAAVAAMGLGAFATDGSVSSANCVGYTTRSLEADMFYLVGVQFQDVGSDSVAGLNDILSLKGVTAGIFDTMETQAPRIDVRVGNVYQNYYYIEDGDDGTERYDITGWVDGAGNIVDAKNLALGEGFWIHVPSAVISSGASMTVAGEVSAATEFTVNAPNANTFYIRANPFPCAVNFANVETSGFTPGVFDSMETQAPRIDVRVGNVYQNYYYIEDGDDGTERYDITGWVDGAGNIANEDVVDVAGSFWIHGSTAGSLKFTLQK